MHGGETDAILVSMIYKKLTTDKGNDNDKDNDKDKDEHQPYEHHDSADKQHQ